MSLHDIVTVFGAQPSGGSTIVLEIRVVGFSGRHLGDGLSDFAMARRWVRVGDTFDVGIAIDGGLLVLDRHGGGDDY